MVRIHCAQRGCENTADAAPADGLCPTCRNPLAPGAVTGGGGSGTAARSDASSKRSSSKRSGSKRKAKAH